MTQLSLFMHTIVVVKLTGRMEVNDMGVSEIMGKQCRWHNFAIL